MTGFLLSFRVLMVCARLTKMLVEVKVNLCNVRVENTANELTKGSGSTISRVIYSQTHPLTGWMTSMQIKLLIGILNSLGEKKQTNKKNMT